MAVGLSATVANAILNALCRNTAWTQPSSVNIKLHLGDPGAAGTTNPATETTRKAVTFGTPASGGSLSNTVAVTWSAYPATEDPTHFSAWDDLTAGNFLFSGTVTAESAQSGGTYTINIGGLTVSQTVAA